MNAADRLAEIEALVEAASEGPWLHLYEQDGDECGPNGEERPTHQWSTPVAAVADVWFEADTPADAALIAHARTDLLATTKALRAVLALAYMSDDGSEYEHNEGCEGEAECPACWAADIRRAITEALGGAA